MSGLDLLAFGPHPDDLEIGLGGTIAKHASLGHSVGLCDVTRGEMSSNGTPEERVKEAEAARAILGAAWRENLALPDRAIGSSPDHTRKVVELIRRVRPRAIAVPYWHDRHPDHESSAALLRDAVFNAKLKRYEAAGDPWQPEWVCYYFINDAGPASFVVDVSGHYETKRRALACYASQFTRATESAETRLNSPSFSQLIESRDAHFGALAGVRYAEGIVVKEPVVREHLLKVAHICLNRVCMHIGVVCYASVGGSGIVATELAKSLARRGHQVHLISTEPPFRLGEYEAGLAFHRVHTPTYPLFREPQYLLSLSNKIVQLSREFDLDIVHAHYAIPHATAAYLAKHIIGATNGGSNAKVPKVITTLHGTDITLLGSDPSYSETVAFSIDQSDGVTAVSDSLRRDTYQALAIKREIRVIPNFLECDEHRRRDLPDLRARLCPPAKYDKLIIHLSNFRPVKRVDAVVEIFEKVRKDVRAKLIFVGEGPELGRAMRMVHERGLACDVEALGEQDQVVPLLSVSDLFVLPSAQESFGLAALEAMACQVPVVASRVGGLPEVVEDGVSGYLCEPEDVDGMAKAAIALLTDPVLHLRFAQAGLERVRRHFCSGRVVPQYEAYYQEVIQS